MNRFLKTGSMVFAAAVAACATIFLASLSWKISVMLIFLLVAAGLLIALSGNPKALSGAIVAYPAFVILLSIIFPGMKYRIEEAIFPVINLGIMRVRVEELIFYGLASIWLTLMFFSTMNRKKQRPRLSGWFILLVVAICLWTALSTRIGIINHNPNVTTELRQIAPILLGLPMAVWALRRIDQDSLRKIMISTVLLLVISNLFLLFSCLPFVRDVPYFVLWHRHLPPFCFSIILYLLCLVLVVSTKPSLLVLTGMLPPLSIALFVIHKWWLFGIAISILFVVYASFWGKSGFHLFTKKVGRLTGVSLLVGITAVIGTMCFSEMAEQSLNKFEERVLREDAGGDMSGGRLKIWTLLVRHITESPIAGKGLGFRIEGILPPEIEAQGKYMEDHNIILWIAVRFGIPFLLLIAVLCLRFLVLGGRAYQAENRPFQKTLILICMGIYCVILSMSFVGQWLFIYEISVLFSWSIAAVLALRHGERGKTPGRVIDASCHEMLHS